MIAGERGPDPTNGRIRSAERENSPPHASTSEPAATPGTTAHGTVATASLTDSLTTGLTSASAILEGGGEMGALMRGVDWTQTTLGAVTSWPQSLKTTVSTCLNSRFPILVWWGPELVMLYNDAYQSMLGSKHPHALGAHGRVMWPEIWPIIEPMLGGVLARGEATWSEDQLLLLERHGYPEECYFTFSYSPIRDETGGVGGVFSALTETTGRVLGTRRLATLQALAERTAGAPSPKEAAERAVAVLAENAVDVPFALLYFVDDDGLRATLTGTAHLTPGSPAAPLVISLDASLDARARLGADSQEAEFTWPVADVVRDGLAARVIIGAAQRAVLPPGPWPAPPSEAYVLPVMRAGQARPHGVLVTGINPHRTLDDDYRGFLGLVAGHVATAVGNARAYEAERERTAALAEIDRAKTTFFSNVSHEFRTPLTLMLGPLERALSQPDAGETPPFSPAHREELTLVHRNGLRLLKLVNTLLDFSRIEAGRVQARFEPTDLSALTTELASTFRSAIDHAGLTLTLDCPPWPRDAAFAYVDREMWERVVLNLVSNAFKHTFEGGITVRLRPPQANRAGVALEVADTGVGVPAAELPRLFERFHRVQGARARTHEGTGIGLALVQELVRMHGGVITVESVEGRGTAFTVTLPAGTAHLPTDRIREGSTDGGHAPEAAGEPTGPRGPRAEFVAEATGWLPATVARRDDDTLAKDSRSHRGSHEEDAAVTQARRRVLVVDDNADMRSYISRLLEEAGYVVDTSADGVDALEALRVRRPDLVLSDVMMPRLDGFGLLAAVRAAPETHELPVILLSARAGEESRVDGMGAGADDYLIKPFSARELLARVGAHLGLALARTTASAQVKAARSELERSNDQLRENVVAAERALAELRREQARLVDMFRQAPAFLAVLRGPTYVFEAVNDAYYQLVGYRDLIGKPLFEALPEVSGQGYEALLDDVLATGVPFVGRAIPVRLARTPGAALQECFIDFVYMPHVEADGTRSGIVCHGSDVTEQVLARREIERLLGESERARGDAETARSAAETARAEAVTANRAKGEFLAIMSHELRTPLNAIGGYAELLEMGLHGPVTSAQRTALERIQRSQRALLSVINEVLNFARLETGAVSYNVSDVPVDELVAAAEVLIAPQLRTKGLRFVWAGCGPELAVRADRDKVQQILLNLLSNAIKFTDPSDNEPGRVAVECVATPGSVVIRVRDTGIGIPDDQLERIFEPFVQVDARLTRTQEGTGLGLAISRDLARGMGGDLTVESVAGVGSTFTLTLPNGSEPPGGTK